MDGDLLWPLLKRVTSPCPTVAQWDINADLILLCARGEAEGRARIVIAIRSRNINIYLFVRSTRSPALLCKSTIILVLPVAFNSIAELIDRYVKEITYYEIDPEDHLNSFRAD